jgi:hypothetical protein
MRLENVGALSCLGVGSSSFRNMRMSVGCVVRIPNPISESSNLSIRAKIRFSCCAKIRLLCYAAVAEGLRHRTANPGTQVRILSAAQEKRAHSEKNVRKWKMNLPG